MEMEHKDKIKIIIAGSIFALAVVIFIVTNFFGGGAEPPPPPPASASTGADRNQPGNGDEDVNDAETDEEYDDERPLGPPTNRYIPSDSAAEDPE